MPPQAEILPLTILGSYYGAAVDIAAPGTDNRVTRDKDSQSGGQLSAVSYQLSAVSFQRTSAIAT